MECNRHPHAIEPFVAVARIRQTTAENPARRADDRMGHLDPIAFGHGGNIPSRTVKRTVYEPDLDEPDPALPGYSETLLERAIAKHLVTALAKAKMFILSHPCSIAHASTPPLAVSRGVSRRFPWGSSAR